MARLSSEQTRDVIHKVVRLFFDLLQENNFFINGNRYFILKNCFEVLHS